MVASESANEERAAFGRLLAELRPRLHRYCARMMGSVIDGEDVVQEAFTKALAAFQGMSVLENPEAWLFRIAHHAALDLLRRRARERALVSSEETSTMADPSTTDERLATAASLHAFMRLPVAQRSCVILKDVLGYSLQEIEDITRASIPAIKASLHRGRAELREIAAEPEDTALPSLGPRERALLVAYADRFNARDFDAVRDLLAEEVRLEVVSRTTLEGKAEVAGTYFVNYGATYDWHFVPGLVEGRPAMLVWNPLELSQMPCYFVLLEWTAGLLSLARDFRHATYVTEGAAMIRLPAD